MPIGESDFKMYDFACVCLLVLFVYPFAVCNGVPLVIVDAIQRYIFRTYLICELLEGWIHCVVEVNEILKFIAVNAALLSIQILAVEDVELAAKLDAKREADAEKVLEKDAALQ